MGKSRKVKLPEETHTLLLAVLRLAFDGPKLCTALLLLLLLGMKGTTAGIERNVRLLAIDFPKKNDSNLKASVKHVLLLNAEAKRHQCSYPNNCTKYRKPGPKFSLEAQSCALIRLSYSYLAKT